MYKVIPVMFLLLLFVSCGASENSKVTVQEQSEPENLLSQIHEAQTTNFEKFGEYDPHLLHDIIPFDAKYEYDFEGNSKSFRCTATDTWTINQKGEIEHFTEKIKK